jgi:hypothetical protein
MRPLSFTDVARDPDVTYRVSALLITGEQAMNSFEREEDAREVAEMLRLAGATGITLERVTLRVIEEVDALAFE